MNHEHAVIPHLTTEEFRAELIRLYGSREGMEQRQFKRYLSLLKKHQETFGRKDQVLFVSAPGRTEIGGNHTDHNHGKVLAAAVNLDTLAAVSIRDDGKVNLHSEGYPPLTLSVDQLEQRREEEGKTHALVRGVAKAMQDQGFAVGGFDAVVTSSVRNGSGLSSSAAFEVMVCAIFDALYHHFQMEFVQQAKMCQFAENVYFGKPSGLLDQMASAAGGLVTVDFGGETPAVQRLSYDFARKGYSLVVVATGGNHADLTPDYAAIPAEMKAVAGFFGKSVLREVPEETFLHQLPALYRHVPDRAILRAMHFYQENQRVDRQVAALAQDDMSSFFQAIIESGQSSFMYLQNVYAHREDQGLSIALAMAEKMLRGQGAWRIHGGGFAGTTLNFVPHAMLPHFQAAMDGVFGQGSTTVLDIRPQGAAAFSVEKDLI